MDYNLLQESQDQKTIRFEEILNEIDQLHALMDIDRVDQMEPIFPVDQPDLLAASVVSWIN